MTKKQIKKIVEKIVVAMFISLTIISIVWLIVIICSKAIGRDLSKAICYVNDEKIELNINYTKKLNDFDYEVTLDNGEK